MSCTFHCLLLVVVVVVEGASVCPGGVPTRCPPVDVVHDFDVVQYLGRWFEIARVPQVFQPNGACVTATYAPTSDLVYPVKVTNRQRNDVTGAYEYVVGGVRAADVASTDAELRVKFSVTPAESDYWVLDTDYDNYAVVYSCRTLSGGGGIYQSVWVLGRENKLTFETKKAVDTAFRRSGLDRNMLTKTRQDYTCDYDLPVVPTREIFTKEIHGTSCMHCCRK